jgi:hypothetical protein
MKVGDTIKWTAQDKPHEEKFSEVGVVKVLTPTRVKFKTKHGLVDVRLDDGTFEVVEAGTSSLDTQEDNAGSAQSTSAQPTVKAGSKLERAIAIVKANPTASRKELIQLIVDQLGMSAAGASTYAHNAKKAVAGGA